ncbi:hypothetical protein JCM10908_002737 [Rhodotorula pacifica]|uniref:peptide alpha-N-acetyltransferase MAK3 n=1 Tax=Rhodotorula pacifica TaxID=1495444 RepID=UPI00317D6CE4
MTEAVESLPSLHALSISPAPSRDAGSETDRSTPSQSQDPTRPRTPTPRSRPSSSSTPTRYEGPISYRAYQGEQDLDVIVDLVDDELSEPYNLYTYRYFLDDWPHLCFFAYAGETPIGVIVCKQEPHTKSSKSLPVPDRPDERRPLMRGYLAMLSTRKEYRGRGVATHLLRLSLSVMLRPPPSFLATLPPDHPSHQPVDEIVLETEADNTAALAFYAKMGFVREKRLHRFYLNGKDAYRLRLDLTICAPGGVGANANPVTEPSDSTSMLVAA